MIKTLYEAFQHWSDGGSVYLYSDPHFNDADCVYMDPNWMPPDEQVDVINYIVKRPDTFICLGDVGDPDYARQIKANRKILNAGKTKPERVEKFKKLLALMEQHRRKNQYE